MSFASALRERLKAGTGARVAIARRPDGVYPAIALTVVSSPIGRHMTGLDGWRRPRVQIDVFALDTEERDRLSAAVVATIAPSASVGGVRFGRAQEMRTADMSEQTDTVFVFRDMIEAVLPHQLEN